MNRYKSRPSNQQAVHYLQSLGVLLEVESCCSRKIRFFLVLRRDCPLHRRPKINLVQSRTEGLMPTHRTRLSESYQHPEPIYTHSDSNAIYPPVRIYSSFFVWCYTSVESYTRRTSPNQIRFSTVCSAPPFALHHIETLPTSPQTVPFPLIASKCLRTAILASINRSTQFCAQASSVLSSLPLEMRDVMHFFQQISVRLWIAAGMSGTRMRVACVKGGGQRIGEGCGEGVEGNALFCTMAFWDSCSMNRESSRLSLSESLDRSIWPSDESIMGIPGVFVGGRERLKPSVMGLSHPQGGRLQT